MGGDERFLTNIDLLTNSAGYENLNMNISGKRHPHCTNTIRWKKPLLYLPFSPLITTSASPSVDTADLFLPTAEARDLEAPSTRSAHKAAPSSALENLMAFIRWGKAFFHQANRAIFSILPTKVVALADTYCPYVGCCRATSNMIIVRHLLHLQRDILEVCCERMAAGFYCWLLFGCHESSCRLWLKSMSFL